MKRRLFLFAFLLTLTSYILSAQQAPATQAVLTFVKEFPGSVPPYYSITLRRVDTGNTEARYVAEYRAEPDEEPTELRLTPSVAERAFALTADLGWFAEPNIESGRKVAQMGKKTLRYEDGEQHNEAVYNHTELLPAIELTSWFEKLSATQRHVERLDYLLRFDKLGVVKELLQIEMDLNSDRLLEPKLLLAILDKVLATKSLVNVAHDRANQIVSRLSSMP
jgi:hypothetical protein